VPRNIWQQLRLPCTAQGRGTLLLLLLLIEATISPQKKAAAPDIAELALTRARCFGAFALEWRALTFIKRQMRIPDAPYSLFEGNIARRRQLCIPANRLGWRRLAVERLVKPQPKRRLVPRLSTLKSVIQHAHILVELVVG
jgi:hypothetical protein